MTELSVESSVTVLGILGGFLIIGILLVWKYLENEFEIEH